jgi:hypothetical protein
MLCRAQTPILSSSQLHLLEVPLFARRSSSDRRTVCSVDCVLDCSGMAQTPDIGQRPYLLGDDHQRGRTSCLTVSSPTVHRRMIDLDASLSHHLCRVSLIQSSGPGHDRRIFSTWGKRMLLCLPSTKCCCRRRQPQVNWPVLTGFPVPPASSRRDRIA